MFCSHISSPISLPISSSTHFKTSNIICNIHSHLSRIVTIGHVAIFVILRDENTFCFCSRSQSETEQKFFFVNNISNINILLKHIIRFRCTLRVYNIWRVQRLIRNFLLKAITINQSLFVNRSAHFVMPSIINNRVCLNVAMKVLVSKAYTSCSIIIANCECIDTSTKDKGANWITYIPANSRNRELNERQLRARLHAFVSACNSDIRHNTMCCIYTCDAYVDVPDCKPRDSDINWIIGYDVNVSTASLGYEASFKCCALMRYLN
ncbi:hypothetical protein PUN28_004797 [Cardiocondyla obscurior]|uniref:Uncharacterized protein n=1 Tax=Cardiocondyla obscurior TaxID=286306 RepID=A0AAW2GEF3_9HYME